MSASLSEHSVFASRPVGDIAATLPGATAVFRRTKLDFCCGGRASLAAAAAAKGLDLTRLEAELADLVAAARPAEPPVETDALIDRILTRFHDVHRRELPELTRLARRVEAVHRAHADVPAGLADLLEQITVDLESHMRKEEQVLFPMMRRESDRMSGQQAGQQVDRHPMIGQPIAMMVAEHDDHGAYLRRLEALTHDFIPPADACPTWRALYTGARKFADDLVEHIHTENNILFPRFAG
ncbi:iron-sulfur cluster repair di-iron protein [Rhodopila sp.]|jgi:regulator of cell morphogenesis and NO signaling|uniref:iron-sulfur cluster repair di-iron protein n=1 Tax=Rhodopila sp. TaxID=2480087 RepID=UPI002B6D6AE3|nr:iron-sulfur cluster repair di-iron protein [Rhodopila sp.]HVZ09693.1 iron-sulfur cluster repair di-iron protein [Rhodopila sp.]